MLNFDVKRKINTLRDILVGKIPDPKSQVEQITIALIYKFMDDMDLISAEFGERQFFTGEYEKYAWSNIMNPQISGTEKTLLYMEGIEKMQINPGIPALFRNIFRGAFLPYRDPETLNMFLKEISDFSYENSEDLGNAYEYLLSIMDSQGDAGQFRTPRHIIDMIVEIVEPKKNDTILDPACGTAGFLISAYKYIMEHNKDKDGNSTLTADERERLTKNFAGYDISQDMVRLSRVNMYLHGFLEPDISEYDTLTSLDKWDDTYDVILANPPFMSPKGGIRPHQRFQIQANRSEVLFVDYIAEHLNTGGRAGVIVPEGIVFQSTNAYKNLRKMLIDNNYLYTVISLPAGVFNPYAGVKTSILLFDRMLAAKTDNILFVKIQNDGFDLGAQRREIRDNDIPRTIKLIKKYKDALQEGRKFSLSEYEQEFANVATKEDVKEKDYILVGDRYRKVIEHNGKWPMVELGVVLELNFGTRITKKENEGTKFPVYGGGGNSFYTDTFNRENEYVISRFAMSENCVRYVSNRFFLLDSGFTFNIKKEYIEKLNKNFVGNLLLNLQQLIYACARGHAQKNMDINAFKKIKIPLPPLSVQAQIVEEIEGYQKIIDGAKQIVENYKPTIKIDPEWEMEEIGKMYDISYGVTVSIPQNEDDNGIKIISTAEVGLDGSLNLDKIRKIRFQDKYKKFILKPNTLLFNWRNAPKHVGKTALFSDYVGEFINASFLLSLVNKDERNVNNKFIWCAINNLRETGYFMRNARQAVNQTNFNGDMLSKTRLAVPDIKIQNQIVLRINEEMAIVEQNKRLIEIFEQKIKNRIAEVWGG